MLRLSDGKYTRPYLFIEQDYHGYAHESTRYEEYIGFAFTSRAAQVTVIAPSGERLVYKRALNGSRFEVIEDTRNTK